ncbi:DUF2017 family protein [Microbacterium sp. CIAB417]|uniref:DUF2017 family protein n=1 Tax=Microbacterium sp. CIAB417 TaxID=2860287 RepID=UPI001FACCAFC|nr:DUF2017 family protein [Microbacterium sp. CIAB417]
MNDGIRISLAAIEGHHLARLVDEFARLLSAEATEDAADPALARLAPDAYPEDAEASLAFTAATQDDLLDRRASDAAVVRAALTGFTVEPDGGGAHAPQEIEIPDAEIDAWLRTLTALRLVLAARLGIIVEDDLPEEDPRRGVYDWLGYRLETLIQAADERS